MTALLLLHALVGVAICTAGRHVATRRALLLAVVPSSVTFAWLVGVGGDVVDGRPVVERTEWVGALGLGFDLRLDTFSVAMGGLVAGIGIAVLAYSFSYFSERGDGDVRLIGLLVLFSGSMLGIVLADDLIVLFGFWELTSISSFFLIGNRFSDSSARGAALQALLVTSTGGLAMLAGFVLIGQQAGTYRLSSLLAEPPSGRATEVALALILFGAFTKSAQVPFHAWLPGAMVAPTPVSAYLHSATMVTAGVYLVARFSPAFAPDVTWWRPVVIVVGLATMFTGGLRALRQHDLKLLLAYGTVSQLGLMMVVFAIGSREAAAAGTVLLVAHGLFKAAAFMYVGTVDQELRTRDVRRIPRVGVAWAAPLAIAAVATLSMAGVPFFVGFIAKESVLAAIDDAGDGWWTAALWLAIAGSVLTAGYSARFLAGGTGRLRRHPAPDRDRLAAHAPRSPLWLPAGVLATATLLTGLAPSSLEALISGSSASLTASESDVHLALWHGVNAALLGSVVALLGGTMLFAFRRRVGRVLALGARTPSTVHAYGRTIQGLNAVADRVTSVVQSGSLPVYTGVILTTAAVVPAMALIGAHWPGWPDVIDSSAHVPIVIVIAVAAVAAAAVRRRLSAALFLGVVGYAMAALFISQGAPDLALTQVAIETLTTVLFVLVLRRLPDGFRHEAPRARRTLRLGIAALVGFTVFGLALVFGATSPQTTVSDEMIERSLPDGDGRNVVNVILVDFRGFDTLGELMVLGAAAIGIVALARAGRGPRRHQDVGGPIVPPPVPMARLATLDTSVRLVFAAVLMGSVYLLFAGHNQPGGGFVGGIVAGAAVSLRYVAGGIEEVRRLSRAQPWHVLGGGLLVAVATALVPVLAGGSVLETGSLSFTAPVLGDVKATSALVFDIGVYLAVVGLVLMVFESFGDDPLPEQNVSTEDTTVHQ